MLWHASCVAAELGRAATSIQRSGWSALCYEPLSGQLLVEQTHDHQGNLGNGTVPLLVLDMWEHAYYLQYRNEKAKWVNEVGGRATVRRWAARGNGRSFTATEDG